MNKVQRTRFTLHTSRFTFHASRFTLHASRLTFHASHSTLHAKSMEYVVIDAAFLTSLSKLLFDFFRLSLFYL